ncbi:NAD(P)H-binding protein [Sphingobacterium oryzagri]|uniref:NAD(P)H-binding protein n=1 Tax=Sphingobacterium oryzagri TaxID=3025669 RepID=A0ABY7WCF0_9SPHI|nr:NAD(P)H-binding protein [Sphingobacterium sp. KACC 22765]WDF67157.1 NAD(P)H-binding protein [Sphingobacterium sp. KACC 22765]
MRALVIGATGATGKEVVKQLLVDDRFTEVVAFVRRKSFSPHPKLSEIQVDFEKLEAYAAHIYGDVAFSCLGTTLKDAGSKEAQWRVDHDYQLLFAQLCQEHEVRHFILLSAIGVDPNSAIFYNKMKGTLEMEVKALHFNQLSIVQPSLILRPGSNRMGEVIAGKVLGFFNSIGLFKRYAGTSTEKLAEVLIAETNTTQPGVRTLTAEEYLKK